MRLSCPQNHESSRPVRSVPQPRKRSPQRHRILLGYFIQLSNRYVHLADPLRLFTRRRRDFSTGFATLLVESVTSPSAVLEQKQCTFTICSKRVLKSPRISPKASFSGIHKHSHPLHIRNCMNPRGCSAIRMPRGFLSK